MNIEKLRQQRTDQAHKVADEAEKFLRLVGKLEAEQGDADYQTYEIFGMTFRLVFKNLINDLRKF